MTLISIDLFFILFSLTLKFCLDRRGHQKKFILNIDFRNISDDSTRFSLPTRYSAFINPTSDAVAWHCDVYVICFKKSIGSTVASPEADIILDSTNTPTRQTSRHVVRPIGESGTCGAKSSGSWNGTAYSHAVNMTKNAHNCNKMLCNL